MTKLPGSGSMYFFNRNKLCVATLLSVKQTNHFSLSLDFDGERPALHFSNTRSTDGILPPPKTFLHGIKKETLIDVPNWFQIIILA